MREKGTIRVYTLALLSFAMAAFLLINFILIWAYGKFYVYESNGVVLMCETTFMVIILSFSFICMIEQLRQKN